MSSSPWDNPDGVTPWRSPGPTAVGELFVLPSADEAVAGALALSSLPVAVHFSAPRADQPTPYLVVEPIGAPARQVRVAVVTASDPHGEGETLPWDPYDFLLRRGVGEAIQRLTARLRPSR